jgi:hypothetical protein
MPSPQKLAFAAGALGYPFADLQRDSGLFRTFVMIANRAGLTFDPPLKAEEPTQDDLLATAGLLRNHAKTRDWAQVSIEEVAAWLEEKATM